MKKQMITETTLSCPKCGHVIQLTETLDMLYRYLSGDQFRQKFTGIVETFTTLQDQVQRECRAMEKIWKDREKQIERVITNTVGMYGEMSGILGGSLPGIQQLTSESVLELPSS